MLLKKRIFSLAIVGTILFSLLTNNANAQCPTFSGATYIPTLNQICATDVLQPSYDITYGVSFLTPVPIGSEVFAQYLWGDGTPIEFVSLGMGDGITTSFLAPPVNHIYPNSPGPCEYEAQFAIRIVTGGVPTICPGTRITDQLASWERDNNNGGQIQMISPVSGTNEERVCFGTDVNVVFDNTSTFNCQDQGGGVPKIPNVQARWEQFVYNTGIIANKIPNLEIDGVPVTDGAGGDIIANYQDPRGVVMIPAPATDASPKRTTLPITAVGGFGPAFPQVGDQIEVTLRMWNFCNPYSNNYDMVPVGGDFINGDNPPLESTALVTIVAAPDDPIVDDKSVCYGDALPDFTFAVPAGFNNTSVQWYEDNGGVPGNPIPNGVNNTALAAADFQPGGPIDSTVPGVYTVWAAYNDNPSGFASCESDILPMTLTIREELTRPGNFVAPPPDACDGDTGLNFDLPDPEGTFPFGGDWEYEWNAPDGDLTINGSGQNVTVDVNVGGTFVSTTRRIRARKRYTTNTTEGTPLNCRSPWRTYTLTIYGQPNIGAISGSDEICEDDEASLSIEWTGIHTLVGWEIDDNLGGGFVAYGAGGTDNPMTPPVSSLAPGTYNFRAVIDNGPCNSIVSNDVSITVNPVPPKPTITPSGPTTLCEDASVTLSSSTINAASYQWYKDGLALGSETNQTINLSTVAESGSYTVEVIGIGPTNCTSVISDPTAVTINPLPTAAVAGGGSVCAGNPAPDIVWTLTGTAPFSFTITRTADVPIVEAAWPTNTYTIVAPNPAVDTDYEMTALQDANSCNATVLGGIATVSIIATAPPSITSFTPGPDVCDDNGAATAPILTLDLNPNSVQNYDITFNIYNSIPTIIGTQTLNQNTDGSGITTIALDYAADLGSTPDTYRIEITSIINTVTLCNASGLPDSEFITINPDPADPTNAIDNIACSSDATGATLMVDDPGAGFTVKWYSDLGLSIPAVGVTSGNNEEEFTPTSTATAPYYAVIEDDGSACQSINFATLQHDEDQLPSNASIVTTDFNTCNTSETLTANAVDNGGFGEWVFTSGLVWREAFDDLRDEQNDDNGATGWSLDYTDVLPANLNNPLWVTNDVPTGRRFMVNNPGGNGIRWISDPIVTPAAGNITMSVEVSFNGIGGGDWIEGYYNTDGSGVFPIGAPNWFARDDGPGNIQPSYTLTIPATGTVQLMLRVRNGAAGEFIYFDNVEVREDLGSPIPTFTPDRYSTTVTANNLLETELIPGTNEFTWNAYSALGVCQPAPATVTVTRWSLPAAIDPAPDYCEDTYTSNSATIPDFTFYDDAVTGIVGSTDRTIIYYDDPGRINVVTTATVTTASPTIYTRVIRTDVLPNCPQDGTLTFNILTLPEVIDQNQANNALETVFCEDLVGGGQASGINLRDLDDDIANSEPDRSVAWFADPGYSVVVPDPTSVTASNNDIFYARVTETASGSSCFNDAIATITVNTRPAANPITGANTQCVGGATSLYQIVPGPTGPPATTYIWDIPADFTVFGGGTANDFFVLLQFPVATSDTLKVTEVSPEGCAGDQEILVIDVELSPAVPVIAGPAAVCENETGVIYSVAAAPATTYAWTVPTGASIINGQGTNVITVNFGTTAGNIEVTPTSSGGCSSTVPATQGVAINQRPVLDPLLNETVCSRADIEITLAAAGTSPVPAVTYDVTASVAPGLIANTGPTTGNGLTAGAIFNDNYTNTTGGPLTVTYTVTPISLDNCAGASVSVLAIINPEPVMASGLDVTECSDQPIGLNFNTAAGSVVAANYNLVSVTVPGGLTAGGSNAPPLAGVTFDYVSNDTYTNTGNAPLVVQYLVEPVSGDNCVGGQLVINATIDPEPVMSTTLDDVVCSDLPIGIILNTNGVSIGANSYFLVDVSIPGGVTPGGTNAAFPAVSPSNAYIANDVYTNETTLPVNVIYEVQGISAANCFGDSEFITVTINPEPKVNPAGGNTVCSDAPSGITVSFLGTSVAANDYNYVDVTIPVGVTAAVTNVPIPSSNEPANYIATDSYTNTTNAAVNVVYEIRGVSADGCVGDSQFITLVVDPEPVIDPALDATVCSDQPIGLNFATNGTSVAAASYDYLSVNPDPGLTPDAGNVILANGIMAGYVAGDQYTNTTNAPLSVIYEVRGTAGGTGCVGDSEFITITINPEPVMSPALNTTVCSDDAINVVFATNGTSIAAANYNVVGVTIPPGLTAGANAAFPASGVVAGYIASDTYTNQTTSPIVVTYDIQGVSGAGCTGDALSIDVTINPEPVISTTLDATVCSDEATNLTLSTLVSSVAAANYNIIDVTIPPGLTAGANATVPANGVAANYLSGDTYENLTNGALVVTYEVRGVSATPCVGDSEFINITINPEPVIDNTLNATVCSNDPIALALGTDPTSEPAVNYDVVSRSVAPGLVIGGSNAFIPGNGVSVNYLLLDTYQNPTNAPLTVIYNVRGNSVNGCTGDLLPITITIDPEPVISPALDKTVCSDEIIALTLNTNGVSVAADDYNVKAVTIPAGLTAAGGNAIIPGPGVAAGYLFNDSYTNQTGAPIDVTYEVTGVAGACEGVSEFIVISIDPEPVIDPGLDAIVCSDDPVGITLNTNGVSVAAANYNIVGVTVPPGLTAGGGNVLIPSNNELATYFANDTYENTTGGNLDVVYDVRGVSADGCVGDLESITVTILPEPVLDPGLDDTVCSDEVANITLGVAGGSVAAATYNIIDVTIPGGLTAGGGNAPIPSAGEPSTYLSGDTYTNTTNADLVVIYEVRPVSGVNCEGNSEFINLTINPEPVINTGLDKTVCSDEVINLTLNTNGVSTPASTYNVKAVSIPAGVTAALGNAPIPGNAVLAGYLNADSYTNQTAGPLVVTYEVTGNSGAGCEGDSEFVDITINPEPVIDPALDNTICSDEIVGVTLGTNGTSVVALNYNLINVVVDAGLVAGGTNVGFPNNGVAANYFINDTYTNQTTGQLTATYEVRGVSAAGCVGDSEFIVVTIRPEPIVSNALNTTICSDDVTAVNFATDPSAVGAATYNLLGVSIDAGLFPAGTNAPFPQNGVAAGYIAADAFTNTTAGALTVTYNVQGVSIDNCLGDTRAIVVTVEPEPVIDPGLDATVCSDLPIGLVFNTNGTSVAANNYNLIDVNVGLGLVAGGGNVVPANGINANYVSNDTYTNTTNGPIDVTYEVRGVSLANCTGKSEIITITINPEPTMNPGLDKTVCSDELIALNLSDNGLGIAATTFNIVDVTIPGGLTPDGGNALFPALNQAGNYIAGDLYNNVTAGPLDVIYEVRGVSAVGCIGDSEFITVTINPEPVISNSLDATVCSDEIVGVTLNTNGISVAAANYNIISVNIPGGLTAGGSNVVIPANAVPATYFTNDTYTNQTSGAIVVSYLVEGVSADNCTGDQQIINVTINPEPVINAGLDNTVCSDAATGLVLNTDGISIGASNYNIIDVTIDPSLTADAGNAAFPATGVAAAYLSNDVFTNATNGPLDVVYEVRGVSFSACEGDSRFVTITIEPGPIVDPNLDATLCSDIAIGVTLTTDAGSVAATAYNVLAITPNPSLIPGGGNVPAANNVAANYIFNDTYTNTTSIPLTVTYEVKGVSAATCRGPSEFIVVTIDPEPVIDPGLDKTVCSDEEVGLILNTNGVSVGANTYNVIGVTIPFGVTADAGNATVPATGVVDGYLSNDKYTNTTNGPLVVIYEARGESTSTCEGKSRFINITIDPEPVIDPNLDATVCSDVAVGVTLATNGTSIGAVNYNILTVTPAVGLTASGSNVAIPANGVAASYFINDSFTNKTSGPLNVIYEVRGVSADNCVGDSEFITVTIDPEPVVDAAITNTVCSDEFIAINLGTTATSVNASTYDVLNVTIPAGLTAGTNAPIPGNAVGIGYISTDTYTNLTAAPIDVIYEVRGNSLAGCTGDIEFISVRINAEPVLNPALDATVCSDEPSGVILSTNGTSVTASTYNLISVTPQAGLVADPGNAVPALNQLESYIQNDRFTNTSNIDLTVLYVVQPVSALNCLGDSETIVLTINPEPVLDPALSPAPVCSDVASGVILSEQAGSVAATSYNILNITWDAGLVPGGGNSSIGNGQAANAIAADVYTNTSNAALLATYDIVPVSADNCEGDIQQVVFTINPAPALSTALDEVVCSDANTGIILATDGVSTPAQNYEVQSVVATGLTPGVGNVALPITTNNTLILNGDTYTNPTDGILTAVYTVVPISAPGCRGPVETITVTVEPEVTAVATNTTGTICSNSSTSIILTSPSVPSAGDIVFNVTAVGSSPAVSGFIPTLNFLPQGYEIADFLINTGNTQETVTYTITPVASGGAGGSGCPGTAVVEVINVDPLPIITPGQFDTNCSDEATNYTILTQNNLAGTTFTWPAPTLSDPGLTGGAARTTASDLPIGDTFVNTTGVRQSATYDVTPIGPSSCVGAVTQITIFIDPTPVGTIAVDNPVICLNGSALLSFTMTVGVAPFEIVYSDGTTDFTVSNIPNTHFIAKNGLTETTTYTLKSILDVNGCLATLTDESVTVVVENPIADFTADITEDCTPLVVTFTNNDIQDGTQYEWNWGDGSPIEITSEASVEHTFVNNSTFSDVSYNVILTARRTNGTVVCTSTATEFVTINAGVSLSVNPIFETEGSCSPVFVRFVNNSLGVLEHTWFWREQGTTDQNDLTNVSAPSFVLENLSTTSTIYEVVYIGTRFTCGDTVITEIEVDPDLTADFTVAPGTTISINDPTITVTNNTLNKNSWDHTWNWGDGTPETNAIDPGSHTYANYGDYELSLTIVDPISGCEDTQTTRIRVEPVIPVVDFEVDITEGCRPLTVTFTNLSTSVDPNTYLWEFTDERGTLVGTSTAENPTFTFYTASRINVSLSGSNSLGITDTETKLDYIEVFELPIASFTVTPETVYLPDQLLFTSNLSALSDYWTWDFDGDGIPEIEGSDREAYEPTHKYESAGVFNISMIATNTVTTCTDTLVVEKAVKVIEGGAADIPNGFFPGSGDGDGGNSGGSGGSGAPNSVFLPRVQGVRDDGFLMQIFDRWGHLLFESTDKTVGWNGRDANGKLYPVGVYVYQLELVYTSGQQATILGDVTLIR